MDSIHNFINFTLCKILNFFIYPKPEFQETIVDRGSLTCESKFHISEITNREHRFDIVTIAIEMGCVEVLLEVCD